jgi:tetratricopeptide (TPR) repeat protein
MAQDTTARKRYARAAALLQQIVKSDAKDFQAWTELANNHFLQKNLADAENEYLRALDAHPGFFLALLNLGRLELSQKNYEVAIQVLGKAAKAQSNSPEANYFLGEAYLLSRKGSLAVTYFREALRLDPIGMAEVHLRLALLYHAAGARDKAAAEYEEFLKKRPDYSEKKKLRKYIASNKKS